MTDTTGFSPVQQKPHLTRELHGQVLTDPFSNLLRIKNYCPKQKDQGGWPHIRKFQETERGKLCVLLITADSSNVPITVSSIGITVSTKLSIMLYISWTAGRKKFKC